MSRTLMLLAFTLGLGGCSTGAPDPRPQTGESEARVAVSVDGERWVQVKAFDRSGPDDRHFVLDRESGTITFGDGRHGRRPAAGSRIEATYRHGTGAEGNLVSVSVVQPQADRAEVSLFCLMVKQVKDGIVIRPCEEGSRR